MGRFISGIGVLLWAIAAHAADLPAAATHKVDFAKELRPLFESTCVNCHAKGKEKGGFSLETRDAFLKGGDTGPAAVVGSSADSLVVRLVAGLDPDSVMPKKGAKWTPEQVALLRAWIDQGAQWDPQITFAKPAPLNLKRNPVPLPDGPASHPIDRFLAAYASAHGLDFSRNIDDRLFARRTYLDCIGLLPTPQQLDAFLSDTASDKRSKLIHSLLSDRRAYAEHWMNFWNDHLRNDYRGAGFIDGGRKQISGWLYSALVNNIPYDRFVAELVHPTPQSEGFSRGIIWRGTVNASMLPPMQAAQNVAQVFMGVNLKCASCHDSFINNWTLADAYGLAAMYSDERLEMVLCDKPTGKYATMRLLYPELGSISADASRDHRLAELSKLLTGPHNGRLTRTVVNRLWARLIGRGLVEPLDDMEKPAWYPQLLDWLAEDLAAHNYDLKHTIELIMTSAAYQSPSVETPPANETYIFRGPLTRRLTAEQFYDALKSFGDEWSRMPATIEVDFTAGGTLGDVTLPQWLWTDESVDLGRDRAVEQVKQRFWADLARKTEQDARKKAEDEAKSFFQEKKPQTQPAREEPKKEESPKDEKKTEKKDPPKKEKPDPLRAKKGELPPASRHRVVFRKRFDLDAVPEEAYAAAAASQFFGLFVNGQSAGRVLSDGLRFGKVAVFDIRPHLVRGENTIAIEVQSHSEKIGLTEEEFEQYTASRNHLNKVNGMAFYACVRLPGARKVEWTSDPSWRTRRAPEDGWNSAGFIDDEWEYSVALPDGAAPVDEAQALEPIRRRDFANEIIEFSYTLRPAVATAAHTGRIRASLLASDPLMTALDRPTREQVMTQRLNTATTLQALELTNGAALDTRLKRLSERLKNDAARDTRAWVESIFKHSIGRPPTQLERETALEIIGRPVNPEGIADLLWSLLMLPEFQLIN